MAILEIVELPDKRLHQKSEPIKEIDDSIRTLAKDMAETMYAAPGIGLAAVQVGEMLRMLTCDVSEKDAPPALMTVINPEITSREGECSGDEGCLSVPGVFDEVKRAERITVKYLDLDGNEQTIEAEGLLAICLQHEIDHLDGVVFLDRLSSLKRKLALRRMDRFKREREEEQDESQQEQA